MTLDTDLPYPRLARLSPSYRWWRPLLTLLAAVVAWLGLVLLSGLGVELVSDRDLFSGMDGETTPLDDPLGLGLQLWFVVAMLPAVLAAVRVVERRPAGTLSSVAGHLRGGLILRCLPVAVGCAAIANTVAVLAGGEGLPVTDPPARGARLAAVLATIIVVVPFQCAAEEYVFRGFLLQTVGAWARPAWVAVAAQVPVFAAGHDYGWKGLLDVSVFALVTAWLTVRSGGLEAGIVLHTVNNLAAFLAGALGWSDPTSDDVALSALVLAQIATVAYAVAVDRLVLRRRPRRWRGPRPWEGRVSPQSQPRRP
jgi:membrane protease YdiL (CAAX protease family)